MIVFTPAGIIIGIVIWNLMKLAAKPLLSDEYYYYKKKYRREPH